MYMNEKQVSISKLVVYIYMQEKKEEEGNKAAAAAVEEKKDDEKKEEEGGGAQEIVLKVDMHCEACARKVARALKGFQGALLATPVD